MAPQRYYVEPVEPVLRRFVEDFRNVVAREGGGPGLLDALRGPTEELLRDPSWITEEFRRPVPGTTATWAVYRSQAPDLCIFTMVVPPGEMTKVHNHLTSGWVGLVQGGQIERMFRRVDDGARPGHAELALVSAEEVSLGELTPLQYPDQDIHQVVTTSRDASVSLHVLCNDLGTVERQTFEPEAQRVAHFVSGYTNVTGHSAIGR
jgi:predicted metal-dependent enzyme (double-stranded beta helix superfamily)